MCSWVSLMMLLLCFSFNAVSHARHRTQPHSSATLVGTVSCDTCFRQQSTHFISGATVAVECGGKLKFRQEVKTNENGDFEAKLPIHISKHVDKIKGCSVKLINSGKPYCSVAAATTATSSDIHFKSKKAGIHIFSAGFFTFKPELCNQKDFTGKRFPPSLPDPPAPFLPPIELLPPLPVPDLPIQPLVPPLPRLPGIPLPPLSRQKPTDLSDKKMFRRFPRNPFQPPSLIPPLPFQPPPPPSLVPPPVFPSPPPALVVPPVPGLVPSPSLPPPVFRVPLPPTAVIPGVPPALNSP